MVKINKQESQKESNPPFFTLLIKIINSIVRITLTLLMLLLFNGLIVWGIIGGDENTIFFDDTIEYYAQVFNIIAIVFGVTSLYFLCFMIRKIKFLQGHPLLWQTIFAGIFLSSALLFYPIVTQIFPTLVHRFVLVKQAYIVNAEVIKKIDFGIMVKAEGCGENYGIIFNIYFEDEYRRYKQKLCTIPKETWNDENFKKGRKITIGGTKTRYGFTTTTFHRIDSTPNLDLILDSILK